MGSRPQISVGRWARLGRSGAVPRTSWLVWLKSMLNTQELAVSEFRHFKEILDQQGTTAALSWARGRLRMIESESVSAYEKDRRISALRVIVEQY